MKALILAAGYATRLYPLTKEYPKPLLKVGGRPIIDYIVEKLAPLKEVDEVIVVTNSKFICKFRRWARDIKINKRVTLIDDLTKSQNKKRGAIGDMDFAIKKERFKDELLVIGGDNLFDGNLQDFLSFAKARRAHPVIGAYNMKEKKRARNYGVVKIDRNNRVVDFKEKPARPSSSLVAMCLYYFPKDKLKLVAEYLNAKANKRDAIGFYISWLIKKEPVYAFLFGGRWYDIGHYQFYYAAKQAFK